MREVDGGHSSSKVGRPAKVWQLDRRAGFAVGVSLNPVAVRAVRTDLMGGPMVTHVISCTRPLRASDVVRAICEAVSAVTEGVEARRVYGVGIAVSGVVDQDRGVVRMSGGLLRENGGFLVDYPFADRIKNFVAWPVRIANDANVGALACFRRMVRQGELGEDSSLLYIMAVENLWGFGAGLVINGRLYTGARGAAGEILHPRLLSQPVELGELVQRAMSGEAAARETVLEKMQPILEHFAALAMSLDVTRVVLGGALAALGEPLQRLMRQWVRQTPGFGPYLADLAEDGFVLDELWPETVALGAAELILADLFCEPAFGRPGPLVRAAVGLERF